jgi:hypothetical protein
MCHEGTDDFLHLSKLRFCVEGRKLGLAIFVLLQWPAWFFLAPFTLDNFGARAFIIAISCGSIWILFEIILVCLNDVAI